MFRSQYHLVATVIHTQYLRSEAVYTGCHRRKGPNFGRVFLRSNYTDITQNTYIQSSIVTEILNIVKWGLVWCLRTVLCPWRHTRRIRLTWNVIARCSSQGPWLRIRCSQSIVVRIQWTTVTRVRLVLEVCLMALCHSQVTLMLSTNINITETTYSCQFQYVFGNQ